jgi:hypothetical protein
LKSFGSFFLFLCAALMSTAHANQDTSSVQSSLLIQKKSPSALERKSQTMNSANPNVPAPPSNSWEAWATAIIEGGKKGLPGRPDAKPIEAVLPVWVDCYLSHYLDQPSSPKNPLISKLVLRSNSKLCAGSLTEWAE